MEQTLTSMKISDNTENAEHFGDSTYVMRTGVDTWSVMDNGESVDGCDLETALRIIAENITAS